MSQIFLRTVNMSISASYVVLAVLFLRLVLKKAPKWITVLLWGIAAVRLICPFSFESVLSLIPSAEVVSPDIMMENTPTINTGIPMLNQTLNPIISESFMPSPGGSVNPLQIFIPIFAAVWVVGIALLLLYTGISYVRVKRRIGTAVLYQDNLYQSENVASPFVLGILKPKIYLPFNMNEQDIEHVVAHEKAHICRKDHLWKPLGFLLLALHWFNPLMWLGYVLLCRDIELACDEKVIKTLDRDARADYTQALLTCSVNRRMIAACPLAFGEVGVRDRVKSVLNYKKPAFWIIIAAIVACVVLAVCFLTNPINLNDSVDDALRVFVDCQIAGRFQTDESEGRACCLDWEVLGKKQRGATTTLYMWVLYEEYSYNGREFKTERGAHIPTVITVKKEDGQYKLIEYWEAKDGSYHVPSIKEKFPWYLHSKALDSQRYIKVQSEKCRQLALDHFGFAFIPENNPAGDLDGLSVVCQAYWWGVKDVSVEFKQARVENGEIVFDLYWKNDGFANVNIGPEFTVYRWDEDQLIALAHKGEWPKERDVLHGKVMDAGGDIDGVKIEHERVISYNLSEHYDLLSPGKYRLEAYGAWVEFQIFEYFTTRVTYADSSSLPDADTGSLRERYPAYFGLDTSRGLDVYVWQMAKNSYFFGLLPHAEQPRNWISHELLNLKGASVDEMRAILWSYRIDESEINIIPWSNPISSYLGEWQIIAENEDPNAKKQAYAEFIRQMLFGAPAEQDEMQEKCVLIYDSPVYSFVVDPSAVPDVVIEDGVIYTAVDGSRLRLGTVEKIAVTEANFDRMMKEYAGFDHTELAKELRENNKTAYAVNPDAPVNRIEIYYIMEQKNGEKLIVYGHYANGEKENEIRFIYRVSP